MNFLFVSMSDLHLGKEGSILIKVSAKEMAGNGFIS